MFNKIKAIKDLRQQAKEMQSKMSEVTCEGKAAGGKVTVVIDGNQQVQSVSIDDTILDDKSKLESAVRDAVNDAVKTSQKKMAVKMKEMGGFDAFKDLGL